MPGGFNSVGLRTGRNRIDILGIQRKSGAAALRILVTTRPNPLTLFHVWFKEVLHHFPQIFFTIK